MFDKNRIHFMNAYYKETGKPFGYLLVDNNPAHQPIRKFLGTYLGNATLITSKVLSKPSLSASAIQRQSQKTKPARKKPMQTITCSDAPIDEWLKYPSGALALHRIPEGYVIIEMYNTSRN